MSQARVAAVARGSMEVFDDVQRTRHQIETDFTRYDDRQVRFKKQFDRETRRHNHAISSLACAINSTPGSNAVLFAREDNDDFEEIPAGGSNRRGSVVMQQLRRLRDPHAQRRREQLQCFYLPPVATTDLICDTCGSFRTAAIVHPLPEPWEEFVCEDNGKRYYYHRLTKQILWTPPPEASPFSVFVFERTNSVFTVCRCIPSQERRKRCMQKFRMYALETARQETEKRNRQLHGAFKTLAYKVIKRK
ncbi:hypothetical protein Poli38472_003530 [Pythium oligandrum]|uniref:WW domain-containing protein n=1 Tax=Pythium oligandrum TaxID=41045 RepID=A0A8K1C792_PYTOL|nr:hypothetical protein Poli38472_003530 [Pythium oligandrum]|eukprot:TMW57605.1 hypothetical protein Poli38472_003530 [Pythium oligandrum]